MVLAFVFESVGAGEWLVLLAVLLVVIGPKNLPSTLRKLGSHYAKFRRAADSFKRQLMDMDREIERSFDEPPSFANFTAPESEASPADSNPGAVYDDPSAATAGSAEAPVDSATSTPEPEASNQEPGTSNPEPGTSNPEPQTSNLEPGTSPNGDRPAEQA